MISGILIFLILVSFQILIYGFTGIHTFAGVAAFSAMDGIAYGELG